MTHTKWLEKTIKLAVDNVKLGGGPFAAIVVKNGKIVGSGVNRVHVHHDPTAHAELIAIREACMKLGTTNLSDCILYASGEPCPMCLGAAYWTTVGTIYYACSKSEALEKADFQNPLDNFYTDQNKEPEYRTVPMIQLETPTALSPFTHWNQKNAK